MKRVPKVLFADDDLKILDIFEEFFSYCKAPKVDCITCSEPLEVEKLVEEHDFDVIFLDFQFDKSSNPEINAIDILKRLKDKNRKNPKIYLLTGVADIPVAVDSIKHGACDVLIKPIDLEKVKNIVLDCYFENNIEEKNDECLSVNFCTEVLKEHDLDIHDAIHINSLCKISDVFQYISKRLIERNGEIYIFANFYNKKEDFNTVFYAGQKSLGNNQIDFLLEEIETKTEHRCDKFINFSQINGKNVTINLIKVLEYKKDDNFFIVYNTVDEMVDFSYALQLFSSSLNRIERSIKMIVED